MTELEAVFNILQDLDMKPTPHNVNIMNAVYNSLRRIAAEMEEKENAGNAADGPTPDPDGRNHD